MTLSSILHRRLFLGVALLSLLAMAGAFTTLATRSTQARSTDNAACAQQDVEPEGTEVEGPDTDTVELECGDQNEAADANEAAEAAEPAR